MSVFDKKKKILVVEDEPDIAEALQARLELEEYEVEVAKDGQEGADKARSFKPDLILLDVMLPKVSGIEVCKVLKADEKTKSIPIVILTALPHIEDAEQAFQAGANDFINKPYTNDRLMQKIHKYLPK